MPSLISVCLFCFYFTARVRSTREGNVLTRVCPSTNLSVHGGGGGSGPAGGGGGVRSSQRGGGVRSSQWGGGSAKIGQQNEYSLHSGRYASCVHAGGLSCFLFCFVFFCFLASCFLTLFQTICLLLSSLHIYLFSTFNTSKL